MDLEKFFDKGNHDILIDRLTRTKRKNLVKLGMNKYKAYQYSNTRKGYWRISNSPILSKTLTNYYLFLLRQLIKSYIYCLSS